MTIARHGDEPVHCKEEEKKPVMKTRPACWRRLPLRSTEAGLVHQLYLNNEAGTFQPADA